MDAAVQSQPLSRPEDCLTPTAAHFTIPQPPQSQDQVQASTIMDTQSLTTPTRESFRNSTAEKRSLPDEPLAPESASLAPPTSINDISRTSSQRSGLSAGAQEVEMMDEEGQVQAESDNESTAGDGEQPAKKKRSQRFFCTDYEPCNLSFTRSEHLARHIRKHTGERPFQCHCLRRFSRLDNLRQHAQTVHVNEEIPGDSLAATGTRFQRQIRTDRIRPSGHRPRTSTMSSGGGGSQSRGHSRNLSNSSVGSISDFGSPEDIRRRHQPLAMAQTTSPRPGLSLDTYGMNVGQAPYYNYSPSGYSTPSVMSADPASPRMPSGLGSPIAMMPRSTIGWGGQNSSRRLSVPSGVNAFHSPHGYASPPGPFMSPPAPSSAASYSHGGSVYGSPTRSTFADGRLESIDAVEADWRRRTWHPSTRNSLESRPATSGLSYHQRPDDPQPLSAAPSAAQQAVRLPGIDSFDRAHIQPHYVTQRRAPDDMEMDDVSQPGGTEPSSKRDSFASINQNLTHLDLVRNNPSDENIHWRQDAGMHPPQGVAMAPGQPGLAISTIRAAPAPLVFANNKETPTVPMEQPTTPRNKKRQGWYMGPLHAAAPLETEPGPVVRTSPEGSSNSDELQTPSTSAADYRPAIMHSNGYIEGRPNSMVEDTQKVQTAPRPEVTAASIPQGPNAFQQDPPTPRRAGDTDRLDALVAVATGQDRAVS